MCAKGRNTEVASDAETVDAFLCICCALPVCVRYIYIYIYICIHTYIHIYIYIYVYIERERDTYIGATPEDPIPEIRFKTFSQNRLQ